MPCSMVEVYQLFRPTSSIFILAAVTASGHTEQLLHAVGCIVLQGGVSLRWLVWPSDPTCLAGRPTPALQREQ
jgi:hypothetical protein